MNASISIVIVTFNSRDVILPCLESLGRYRASVIVVDNASSDSTCEDIRRHFPEVTILANTENIGFGAGCNCGIKASDSEFVLILNPDTAATPDEIDKLLTYAEQTPSAGIIAPMLHGPDGSRQHSCRTMQNVFTIFARRFFRHPNVLLQAYLDRHLMVRISTAVPSMVEWVLGASMLVRRTAITQVGMFDERFFLYCEDMDWCLRMWKNGWRVVYYPLAKIFHDYQRSSTGLNFGNKTTRLHFASFIRFYLKYPALFLGIKPFQISATPPDCAKDLRIAVSVGDKD